MASTGITIPLASTTERMSWNRRWTSHFISF